METQVLTKKNVRTSATSTATQTAARAVSEAVSAAKESRVRRWVFRGVRLLLACALVGAATGLMRHQLTVVSSDQAYLNASLTAVRTPISGQLQLEAWEPGMEIVSGTTVFRVENPRFGNVEAMSQLNWVRELVNRLRVEASEADLRFTKQEELFKHYAALSNEKLLPRLQYLEEETKLALCRITAENRREQLHAAEVRREEIEQQLALQKQADVKMPFDGVVWSVRAHNESEVTAQETVLHVLDPNRVRVDAFMPEKHARQFQVGTPVIVQIVEGTETWKGRVESVRGGVGRMDPEQLVAVPAEDLSRRRVAVRIRLESENPFTAREFFGIGRSVKVTPASHE